MALLPDIKCSRCDRTYSGLRARCPYCGARRNVKSKRAMEDDQVWRVAVALLLLAILFVAVVVLIAGASRDKKDADAEASASAQLQEQQAQSLITPTLPPPTPSPTPTIAPVPIESVQMRLFGEEVGKVEGSEYRYDFTMTVGEVLSFEAFVIPATSKELVDLRWSSSDKSVVSVTEDGEWTALKEGECIITLSADTITVKAMVRVYE